VGLRARPVVAVVGDFTATVAKKGKPERRGVLCELLFSC